MRQKSLVLAAALLTLVVAGSAFAFPYQCRDTAQEIQCEIAADAAYQQCLAAANGDPDAEFVCFLDWRESRQVCDAIDPRCDLEVP